MLDQVKLYWQNFTQQVSSIFYQLRKKENIECRDQVVFNITWKFFIIILVIYMIYISLRTCVIFIMGCGQQDCFNQFYYVSNFAVAPLPLGIHFLVFRKILDTKYQIYIINMTFLILQTATLVFVFYSQLLGETKSVQLMIFSFIQVKFFVFCQFLTSQMMIKIISILFELVLFIYLLEYHQMELILFNTFISAIIMIMLESFYYQLSQQNQIQYQTLQNLPCGLSILAKKGQNILYLNSKMNKLIQKNFYKSNTDTPIRQLTFKVSKAGPEQDLQQEQQINSDFLYFINRLHVPLDQVIRQLPQLSDEINDLHLASHEKEEHLVNLQSIVESVSQEKNNDQKNRPKDFLFRCVFIKKLHEDIDYRIKETKSNPHQLHKVLIDVRIKREFMYQRQDAIMITFYDISQTLKSLYYKSLNNFKSKMIKSISHELRTRLNIIQGMIQIVLNSEPLSYQANQLLFASFQNCKIQGLIIGSMIDYHLIQEKQLFEQNQKCLIVDIVKESIDLFREEFIIKNLRIQFISKIDESQCIEIDAQRLLSVLVHLISNSLKFTNKGSVIITITKDYKDISSQLLGQRKFYSCMSYENMPLEQPSFKKTTKHQFNSISPIKSQRRTIIQRDVNFPSQNIQKNLNEVFYKIEIADTGIGMSQNKLKKVLDVITQDDNDGSDENDQVYSSEGSMMGIRVSNTLLKYLNNDNSKQFLQIQSEEYLGSTVTFFIRAFGQTLSKENTDSIGEEGTLQRRFEASNMNSPLTSVNMNFRNGLLSSKQVENLDRSGKFQQNCQCEGEILIVDDEPYNLLVLKTLMKQVQQDTIQANDGAQCVEIVTARIKMNKALNHNCQGIKAILMDYQMPVMNGRQAAEIISNLCKEKQIKPIPIFGVTGFSSEQDIKALLNAGMVKVYIKPITKEMIKEILRIIEEMDDSDLLIQPMLRHISLEPSIQEDYNK